jgi:hypothetical protein
MLIFLGKVLFQMPYLFFEIEMKLLFLLFVVDSLGFEGGCQSDGVFFIKSVNFLVENLDGSDFF